MTHRWPVAGMSGYDERRAAPVLWRGHDRRERGESGYGISGRGQGTRERRWISDEDGATWGAPR